MGYKATFHEESKGNWIVQTNAPDNVLSDISVYIFTEWVKFATGISSLEGRSLMHPTGKYAQSIHREREDTHTIAVISDPNIAPEANYLEFGHKRYDMRKKFLGRVFPIYRPGNKFRGGENQGFYKVGKTSSTGKNWVIPKMEAYHPAQSLAKLAAQKLKGM